MEILESTDLATQAKKDRVGESFLALAVISCIICWLPLSLHFLFCKMGPDCMKPTKISCSSNIFNWNVFITSRSLIETYFLCMLLGHQKHIEYAKWVQLLVQLGSLHAEKFSTEIDRNK